MVHLLPMTQLMDNDTVDHLWRCEHQHTVEVEVALLTAAYPAFFLIPDGNPSIGDADERGIIGDAGRDIFPGSFF